MDGNFGSAAPTGAGADVCNGSMLSKNSLFERHFGDALSGLCVPSLRSNR